jgi:hypothetical protein
MHNGELEMPGMTQSGAKTPRTVCDIRAIIKESNHRKMRIERGLRRR